MSEAAFIAGDWGTSRLRLYLCDPAGNVLARGAGEGASVPDCAGRFAAAIVGWDKAHGFLPAVLAGMVGSSIGWREVPYLKCPARPEAIAASALRFESQGRAIAILPGLSCRGKTGAPDVLRGEETQILGALEMGRPLLVMPRRAALGEHRNDHQLATARRFAELGSVSAAFDEAELHAKLDTLDRLAARNRIGRYAPGPFIAALRAFIAGEPVADGIPQ